MARLLFGQPVGVLAEQQQKTSNLLVATVRPRSIRWPNYVATSGSAAATAPDATEAHAMTSVQPIDPRQPIADQLAATSPDLLRNMLSTFIQSLMGADVPEADLASDLGQGTGVRRSTVELESAGFNVNTR